MRFNRREPTPPERHLVGSGRVKERRGPPTGRPMGQMIGVLAEPERSRITERIQAGMNEARRRGAKFGRKKKFGIIPVMFTYCRRWYSLAVSVVLSIAALATAITLILAIISFSKSPYNEERLAPAFALVHGVRVYQVNATGPLLSVLYGPMFYIFYWPTTLLKHANDSLLFGTVWSLVFYSLPILYWWIADRNESIAKRLLPTVVFYTLTLASYWPTHVMMAIHPDAAACGLSFLGVLILLETEVNIRHTCISAALCVAAIGCKQNAMVAIPILWTIIWWRRGRRLQSTLPFLLVSTACIIVGVLILSILYGDASAIWFNNYVIPQRTGLEWSKWSAAVLSSYQSVLTPLLFLCVIAGNEIMDGEHHNWKGHVVALSCFTLFATFLLCFPVYLFPGAFGNSFAPMLYSIIGMATLWMRRIVLHRSNGQLIRVTVAPLVFLCLIAVSTLSLAVRTPELKNTLRKPSATLVENYCRTHPGEIYFPFNPVAVWFAERTFYHTDWGLENRARAGFVASGTEFRHAIPQEAKLVAYPVPPGAGPGYLLQKYYPRAHAVQVSGLEGFSVFQMDRAF